MELERSGLGRLQLVRSVTAVDVKWWESKENEDKEIGGQPEELKTGEKYDINRKKQILTDFQPSSNLLFERCRAKNMHGAFAKSEHDIGCIPDLKIDINLLDSRPVQKNYTAIPRRLYAEVKHYLKDLLNKSFICESKSLFSSSVVCVRKNYGRIRLCVDYRELNNKTIQNRHPIPWLLETSENFGSNAWCTTLYQGKAYHQSFISPENQGWQPSKPRLGFARVGENTLRIVKRSSYSFQHFMERCLGELRDQECIPYLDDVIVLSISLNEHVHHAQQVLQRMQSHGLKLKPVKYKLFRREFNFLKE